MGPSAVSGGRTEPSIKVAGAGISRGCDQRKCQSVARRIHFDKPEGHQRLIASLPDLPTQIVASEALMDVPGTRLQPAYSPVLVSAARGSPSFKKLLLAPVSLSSRSVLWRHSIQEGFQKTIAIPCGSCLVFQL